MNDDDENLLTIVLLKDDRSVLILGDHDVIGSRSDHREEGKQIAWLRAWQPDQA